MPEVSCENINPVTWQQVSHIPVLAPASVQIWRFQISVNTQHITSLFALLNHEEQARANAYHQLHDNNRFIISRGISRLLLGNLTNTPPAKIQFYLDKNKKPYTLVNGTNPLHYNLSHSGDWILIAFADTPVGIDIEFINEQFDYHDILESSFTTVEIETINAAAPQPTFYTHWTRKEALVKATGKGIDNDLNFVPCLDGINFTESSVIGSDNNWAVFSFELPHKHVGSIALSPLRQKLIFYETNDLLQIYGYQS